MWPVPEQYEITTAYGKRGSHWSCNENSSGQGVHTGVDFACPSGTPLYATIAGQVRHRNYGSAFGNHQFALSPDEGQPFAEGEVFYAHARKRLADGTHVQAGDWVGEAGAEGNVTGPHLHYEFHPNHKNAWNCSVHDDPEPTLGVSASGPYVTGDVYRSKCGYGEPSNGDESSNTVAELQERLNRVSLKGGQTLDITGVYDDETDEEVRLWQEQICHDDPDEALKSYLGPRQFAAMFPEATYTLHDDGDPAIAGDETPVPPSEGTTLGQWLKAQGFVVHDDNVPLGRESTWHNVAFLMVHHTASPDGGDPADIARYIREGGAGTYPPLAQIMLDQRGDVWMCSQERDGQEPPGRASHAGEGKGYGIPDDEMNQWSIGIECQASGKKPLRDYPVMYDTLLQLLFALSSHYSVPWTQIIGHKEWSSTGKIDPLDNMDTLRNDVISYYDEETPVPPEPTPEPPDLPETITFPLGIQYHYSGKPSGTFTFGDTFKYLDVASWAPTKKGFTFGMLYANVDIDGEFQTHLDRADVGEGTDPTAYQTHFGDEGGDNYLLTHTWFEKGEANRGLRYGLQAKDGQTGTVGTRYVKYLFIPEEIIVALGEIGAAYMAVRQPLIGAFNYLKGLKP